MQAEHNVPRRMIQCCHIVQQVAMWIIPMSLVLILAMTTVSVGPAVRLMAKILYYLAVFSVFASLSAWCVRVRSEKKWRAKT